MATEYTYTLHEFLKDQLPELPGVIRSVALKELRLAMREFFEKSYAWVEDVTDVAIPVGQVGIQVDDADSNTEVIAVLHVAISDTEKVTYQPLVPLPRRPVSETVGESPSWWFIDSNPDEFKLFPYVSVATPKVLTVQVALMPAMDVDPAATTLPRQIALKYYDAIEQGFLARMYAHPNKPYSAPASAGAKRTEFNKSIGFYAAQRKNGYNGAQNWGFPTNWKVARSR